MPKELTAKQKKIQEEKYPALVVGCNAPKGKKQHLIPGLCYRVTEETAKLLIKNGHAAKATPKQVAGEMYSVPTGKKDKTEETE